MPGITEKTKIIEALEEIALLKDLAGENPFKSRAFENAARALEAEPRDLPALIKDGELEKIKGIGKGHIAKIVRDLYETGSSAEAEALRKRFPPALFELFRVPGLGAKRIKALYEKLEIKSLAELEYACRENRLASLEGFGAKTQERVLKGIEHLKKSRGYFLIDAASRESAKIAAFLKRQKGVVRLSVAGSIRRRKEIVRDIDIVVTAEDPLGIHEAFVSYPGIESVIARGTTKSSVILGTGMQCDLRTVADDEFAPALYYFTGSKEHNVSVRTLAKKKGIKINEYGLFKGRKKIRCKTEEDIFKAVGLNFIPPEARENAGEIEHAKKQPFPELVEEKDIQGIFHVHSNYSDGKAPLEDMIRRAEELGYKYIGISDHSQSAHYAGGLEPARIKKQFREIERLQKRFKIRIFKGVESDILADGSLDYADAILREFDFVIGSIHMRHQMKEKEMTARILRALESPRLTILGHPSGRLLLGREGYKADFEKIFKAAAAGSVVMEINANPHRLDLDWRVCLGAKKHGVLFGIHPDAHSTSGLGDVTYGVGIARKAWLGKKDIFNTKTRAAMEKFLKARR